MSIYNYLNTCNNSNRRGTQLYKMKLLKIEEWNYHRVYINNNENYQVYRRLRETCWEKYHRNGWRPVADSLELEKLFTQRDITRDQVK